jgi:methylated-DNA-[protein]-cysteine S-methyltransferase
MTTVQWASVRNISGVDVYIGFSDHIISEITSGRPDTENFDVLPARFRYIGEYLQDHTKQPVLIEALNDFDMSWATDFQTRVYRALAAVPCGTTVSYSALAALAGRPKAVRAVGSAMAKNRFLIVLPCHRIISKDGRLGGFSGGIENKIKLLSSEGIYVAG